MRILASVVLAGLSFGPAWAEGPGTITTHAAARGRLPNTVADVSIGVAAHAPTVAATQAALATGSGKLMAYLRQQGVERLRTEQLSVTPNTVADKGRAERIVGYDGTVQASFRVRAERLAEVVAGALANGGNDLSGTVLQPREAEVEAERARLGSEAAKIALNQADAVAGATGRDLGAIKLIEVEPGPGLEVQRPMMRMAAMAAPAPAPAAATEAGDAEVTATVTLTVELVEPKPTP